MVLGPLSPRACATPAVAALLAASVVVAHADAGPGLPVTERAPSHWSCTEYADYMRWIDGTTAPGDNQAVALHAGYAFVAAGTSGIHVFDLVTEPPALVATLDTPGNSHAIVVSGQIGYVADDIALQIIDVSVPTAPAPLGVLSTAGTALDVAVDGSWAYLAAGTGGLLIVDVTNAAAPHPSAAVALPDARAVAVQSGLAFVAMGASGLRIVDVADPAAPQLRGALPAPSLSLDVAVQGTTCYLGALSDGVMVVDVTDPDVPVLTRTLFTGPVWGLVVAGDHAYVGMSNFGMRVLDVDGSDPPARQGFVELGGRVERGIAVSAGKAYVANRDGLQVVNVRNPNNPPRTAALHLLGIAFGVVLAGDVAYLATSYGLEIVDLSDPWHPAAVGSVQLAQAAGGVDVQTGLAYVAAPSVHALHVIDVLYPASPNVVATLGGLGNPYDVVVRGDYAYVADETVGLKVIDVSNPAAPSPVAGEPSTGWKLDLIGDYLFLYSRSGQVAHVIDVSDPLTPTAVAHIDGPAATGTAGGDGEVNGHVLYLTRGHELEVYDVSDPASPVFLGSGVGPARCGRGIAVRDGRAYLAGSFVTDFQVFDVTNPATPSFEGSGPLSSFTGDVALLDHHLLAAGLSLFPLDCNASPRGFAPVDAPSIASPLTTMQPNPFRERTMLSWSMDRPGRAAVSVYDVAGRLVRRISDGARPAGQQSVAWDGSDDERRMVGAGIYFVRVETDSYRETRKVIRIGAR